MVSRELARFQTSKWCSWDGSTATASTAHHNENPHHDTTSQPFLDKENNRPNRRRMSLPKKLEDALDNAPKYNPTAMSSKIK